MYHHELVPHYLICTNYNDYVVATRMLEDIVVSVGTRRTDGRGPKCIFYTRGCYAAATSLGMGGVGGDVNVHVPCVHTWMLRCCYVTGHGWGGGGGC